MPVRRTSSDIITAFSDIADEALDTSALEMEQAKLEAELNVTSELMNQCIYENAHVAHVALDQTEYQKKYDDLSRRFDDADARPEFVKAQIENKITRRAMIENFLAELRSLNCFIGIRPRTIQPAGGLLHSVR